ncbi:MAG: PTS sugar transporter subunit IIA [Candidatus Omnitrophica bacterium]|nr:PTS sugar transporter subunit IIA [Candidatus Omnitrophota bacterium]
MQLTGADNENVMPTLGEAIKRGGIYYNIGGNDKSSALRNVIEAIRIPEGMDRETLLGTILKRESQGSTGIGDGIAVPHVVSGRVSGIALCFLEGPVDFLAVDNEPVHTLFIMVSPTARIHLHLLSRLMFALKDPVFMKTVLDHSEESRIFEEIERVGKYRR